MALMGMFAIGCDLASKSETEEQEPGYWGEGYEGRDTHTDTGEEIVCEANLTVSFPDGTSISPDFCTAPWLRVEYAYEAGVPPKVRNPHFRFDAMGNDGSACWIELREPGACTEGFYCIEESAGEVMFDTSGCPGAAGEPATPVRATSGYIRLDTLQTETEARKTSAIPWAVHIIVPTTIAGRVDITSAEGVHLGGTFSLTQSLPVVAAGPTECTVHESADACNGDDTGAEPGS